jgi:predicted nucleic acid-binding Zn ribbon protein
VFRKKVRSIGELLPEFLRNEGLETPLQQKRLIDSWDAGVGAPIAAYCGEKFIKNQTLYVKLQNPALRADLTMNRSILVRRLNEQVGAQVIADIRFY